MTWRQLDRRLGFTHGLGDGLGSPPRRTLLLPQLTVSRLKLTAQLCRAIPVGTAGVLIVEGTEDPSFPEPHPERTVDITLGGMSGMPVVVA